jgi:hypothetical protein
MLTPEAALAAYQEHGSWRQAAFVLGVHPQTVQKWASRLDPALIGGAPTRDRARLAALDITPPPAPRPAFASPPVTLPELPDEDVPIDEVWRGLIDSYARASARSAALDWMRIALPTDGPVGLMVFGDPHLGAHGFNAPLFLRHCELCRTVPYLYGVGIGDMANNWVGNLAREYANQETSRRTERRLIEWFLRESGVRFAFATAGNHDVWEQGTVIQNLMADGHTFIADWEAKVRLAFADGTEIRVHAAHDFPGHSMWNPGHGLVRAALMSSDADLYLAGHRHCAALQFVERPDNTTAWVVRARGYKEMDPYARQKGYPQAKSCAAVLVIIDPTAADPIGRVTVYPDVEAGVRELVNRRREHETTRAQRAPRAGASAEPGGRAGRADRRGKKHGGNKPGAPARRRGAAVRKPAEKDAGSARRATAKPLRQPAGQERAAAPARRKQRT